MCHSGLGVVPGWIGSNRDATGSKLMQWAEPKMNTKTAGIPRGRKVQWNPSRKERRWYMDLSETNEQTHFFFVEMHHK